MKHKLLFYMSDVEVEALRDRMFANPQKYKPSKLRRIKKEWIKRYKKLKGK